MNLYQTRSEENGLEYHDTLAEAAQAAQNDPTIWKISFKDESGKHIRLVRMNDGWEEQPLMEEVEKELGFSLDIPKASPNNG